MDIIFITLILFLGFFISNSMKNVLSKTDIKTLNLLWLFHICMSIYFYFFTCNNKGDAWGYWLRAKEMTDTIFVKGIFKEEIDGFRGTIFIDSLNYIPANLMGMGFFANTLFYGLLGFIAFTFLYRICIQNIPYNSKFFKFQIFPLLLFLPNLHFWSSGVGKDTILFLCILMVAYGLMRISKRLPLVVIGLLLSYQIRPHVTLILIVSFGFVYIINGKTSIPQRIFLSISLGVVAIFILPMVLEFVNMDEASMSELDRFSEQRSGFLNQAGSAIDVNMPYPLKVLTFMFRPFFFDINGIPALVASFENLLLLLLFIQVLRSRFFKTFKAAPLVIQGLFIFYIMGALVFSMSMSNLGIILRQRNMFLPGLILFILWSFSYKQQQIINKNA